MDKKELKVLVVGSAGSGKSTLAEFIKLSLENKFFKTVLVESIDGPTNPETFEKRIEALRPELEISIEEIQSPRTGLNSSNFRKQRRCHDCPKTYGGRKIK